VTGGRLSLLWLGIVAAPLAWLAQLLLGYEADDGGCAAGGGSGEVFGLGTDSAALVVTMGALALALLGTAAAIATWRRSELGYARFLGFTGFLGSAILIAAIVLSGVGVVALDPCGQS
jgi:hypothetical protein